MKKLITVLIVAFFGIAIYAQSATVLQQKYTAEVINGQVADTIEFNKIEGEYDLSYQFIPSVTGSGTSLSFTYVLYQSNHGSDDVWTAITTAVTVSTATDSDGIDEFDDFRGLRLRAILTGTSTDTVTVTPYSVYKKHRKE